METTYEVAIIGGGPAGTSAAITLARAGKRVVLLEAGRHPRQKVCGEFVSADGLAILERLLVDDLRIVREAPRIDATRLYLGERTIGGEIRPAGRALSRAVLDASLWRVALTGGAAGFENTAIVSVEAGADQTFRLRSADREFRAYRVIDASGRWSRLHPERKAGHAYLGIKAHLRGRTVPSTVELFFFRGGYCGVLSAGDEEVNVCALVEPSRARSLPEVFALHPELSRRSRDWEMVSPALTTFPVIPSWPRPRRGKLLRAGDASGFINPFLGDGISLALRSGAMAAQMAESGSRYSMEYAKQFGRPYVAGTLLRGLLALPTPWQNLVWNLGAKNPRLLTALAYYSR